MPTTKRLVTYQNRCGKGGRARLWGYDLQDIADLLGMKRLAVRRLVTAGWEPDLPAVLARWLERNGNRA